MARRTSDNERYGSASEPWKDTLYVCYFLLLLKYEPFSAQID